MIVLAELPRKGKKRLHDDETVMKVLAQVLNNHLWYDAACEKAGVQYDQYWHTRLRFMRDRVAKAINTNCDPELVLMAHRHGIGVMAPVPKAP